MKQKIRELETINLDLQTKTNELMTVFDSIQDGVLIFNADGRVQYRNHACPKLFLTEAVIGKSCQDLFHAQERRDPGNCPVEGALRGKNCQCAFSVHRGSRTWYFETTATPIEDLHGKPSRALLFLRDVTDRRMKELQLMQAEKMSSIGLLAAGVAHEINNPLTSVVGYAEALQRRFRENPGLSEDSRLDEFPAYLEVIVRESYRCKSIIERLLSFSRKSDGTEGPVDLGNLVKEVLELVAHQSRYREVEIRTNVTPDTPPVWGDAAGLRQVILNLTLNALQAIEGRGQVDISTRYEEPSAFLMVRDTGHGIPKEVLAQVWDPFFTTKSAGHGVGLGLSVTYNIVQRHGGQVQVESRMGKGSTFTVQLPLYKAA
ncbi:MAG: ATP-binding protein [Deferrisomatales bacterium]|nr:ATP-binding protein [Deferrisomatales bacterium]